MKDIEVRGKLRLAIEELYKNDFPLIKLRCCERSIVFRLGIYLNDIFEEYDVDCEYNKNGDCIKSLPSRRYNFPDIIVHKRKEKENNHLIIEVKTPNDIKIDHFENDYKKLRGFTSEVEYEYTQGVHIFISVTRCSIVWYVNGIITEHEMYNIDKTNHTLYKVGVEHKNMLKFDRWCKKKIIESNS